MSFLVELKRRNVFRVALAYLVFAWVVLQVSDVLFPALYVPAWALTLVAALLAIGFVFIVVFAWVYELTPEGLRREAEVEPDQSITQETGRRLNQLIAVMLVVAVVLLAVEVFETKPAPVADQAQPTKRDGPPVVAVLPFKAVGSDDGGFLAAGLHDDLLTRLAKLGSFRVISRTSMMEYAETTKNMRDIGLELGADYILEGGVQAMGDKVRINAQLIEPAIDEHIWAETYNRNLTATDLFAVQSDIAQAISTEMQTSLTPDEIALVEAVPTQNTEAYNAYLRAAQHWETLGFTVTGMSAVIRDGRRAVELDPEFALAWALLSDAYSRRVRALGQDSDRHEALFAFARARALEPDLLDVELAWVVYLYHGLNEFEQALRALENLGTRADGDAKAVELKGYLYRRLGRFQEAYRELARAQSLDPKNRERVDNLVYGAGWIGDCDAAAQHANDVMRMAPDDANAVFAFVDYELECRDNYDRSRALARSADLTISYQIWSARLLAYVSDDRQRMLELAMLDADPPDTYDWLTNLGHRAWVLRYLGQPEEAEQILDNIEERLAGMSVTKASPDYPDYASEMFNLASMRGDKAATQRWFDEYIAGEFPADKFDHWNYSRLAPFWAWTLVDTGLYDEAVAVLGEMLEKPGGHTWRFIDAMPCFDVLDDHPGFRELRAKYGS
jgi:TolB-like protein/tetratricopeptide (TPR) repeat protein